ncbi:EAL domain-containing protein [Sulfurovum sp. TSL1]|uniref:EAL domain-containing protein n=1 Tax=Sulfurovum sp. TSL1 TaxID=2826994 RepID=UPI001CC73094|nr:EAL domain-containing protein [Sulfurovum sp. TSL1]GIT98375.1 hypothetical protein TSL1_11960 [Sulfurovum sp. TSL1]
MLREIISYKYFRKYFYTHQVISVIILFFSIFIAIFIWSLSKDYYDNLIQEHFESHVHETLSSIEKQISSYEHALQGGIALFHSNNTINRGEWHRYIKALQPEKNYPGVQGIGFSLMLKPEEVTPLIKKIRTHDYPTFTLTPAGEREQYSTILYLEPMDKRNLQAIGYDMFSNPTRREAMERARDTGLPSVSGKVTLVQEIDSDIQSGFLMYLPLYKTIKKPKTVQARRDSLLGFVYSPFRMNDLINVLIKDSSMLNFEIYDNEEPHKGHLLYSSLTSSSYTPQHHSKEIFQIGGREWSIHFSSTREFDTNIDNSYPLFLTIGGLLVYFSLLFITIALFYNREKLKEKSKELESSSAWLNTLIQSSIDGIHLMDRDGKLVEFSPSFLKMLGYTKEEARHLNIQNWDAKFSKEVIYQRLHSISDTPITIETIHRRKDGTLLDVEITTKSIILGGEHYIYASSRDITKRKKNEHELKKLSQALEQSPNTVVITDLKGNIEYVNTAFTTITGYKFEEAIGKNARLLQSGKTPLSAYNAMWLQLNKGKNWVGEFINRRKDQTEYIESIKASPIVNSDGVITNFMAIKEDITEQKRNEARIHHLANFDALTALPNRNKLKEQTKYAISIAKRQHGKVGLLFLDIDHFKNINDTLGHTIGDALLVTLAKRFLLAIREEDIVSRLGGDEFIFMLPNTNEKGIASVARKILDLVSKPVVIKKNELIVTASVGIAIYPNDGTDYETLSKNADIAMYRAKHEGRNNYCFFTEAMQEHSARNLELINALHHALERNELSLVYQPQISLKHNRIIGVEALLRWDHPEYGNIVPSEFITLAEDSGLILPIGEWVLRTALKQAKSWIDHGLSPMTIAVNLSAVQFRHNRLTALITSILDDIGLPPKYLELELTEAVTMSDPESAYKVIDNLHACGINMSIDDFGTGYSSLNYLKKFKVSKLKIDQSFIHDIHREKEDRAIVNAIISMAHSLGLKTIAEGVETAEQLHYLQEQGCDEIQGYYYSEPLSAEALELFVKNNIKSNFMQYDHAV